MATYFVNASTGSNANAGTSAGSPWATLQYALTNSAGGDKLCLCDAATFAESGLTIPDNDGRYLRGYTSAEDDGGLFDISGGGATVLPYTTNNTNLVFRDGKIRNSGANVMLALYRRCEFIDMEITDCSATSAITFAGTFSSFLRCHFHDMVGLCNAATTSDNGNLFVDCLFEEGATNSWAGAAVMSNQDVIGCYFYGMTIPAIYMSNQTLRCQNNSILLGGTNAADGIKAGAVVAGLNWTCYNLVENASVGISTPYASYSGNYYNGLFGNAVYNCTTDYTSPWTPTDSINEDNESLSESPFAKSGSMTFANRRSYFAPVDTGNVRTGGMGGGAKGAVAAAITPLAAKMVKLRHGGMLNPRSLQCLNYSPQLADYQELNSTYTKIAYIGKFHHPQGSGSYDISRVGFYFGGYAVKTGGSGLTVSLQSVDQTQSALTPIGVQEQTVDIANADANFAATTWYRTGTLSSNRTINHGDHVALVIEWDSFGQQGSDFVRFRTVNFLNDDNSSGSFRYNGSTSSWSSYGAAPNCVFEMTDGSFASFSDSFIVDNNFGSYLYDNADSPDEYANSYTPEATVKVDAFCGIFRPPTSEDLDLVIYEGTTAIHTTTVSGWQISLNDNHYWTAELDQEVQLEAHTKYYLALKPTQGTTPCRVYYRSVNDTNHFGIDPYSFGTETAYSRTDGGAWTQIPLRQLMLGVRISSIDNGGTHGAFHPLAGS